ncbi:MAG: hypothetical protein ACHQC8_02585 [Solirubrobacterales bacterium]
MDEIYMPIAIVIGIVIWFWICYRIAFGLPGNKPPTPQSDACLFCGRYVHWFADSLTGDQAERIALWNRVSENNKHYWLCPTCFIVRASALGINEYWRLSPAQVEARE